MKGSYKQTTRRTHALARSPAIVRQKHAAVAKPETTLYTPEDETKESVNDKVPAEEKRRVETTIRTQPKRASAAISHVQTRNRDADARITRVQGEASNAAEMRTSLQDATAKLASCEERISAADMRVHEATERFASCEQGLSATNERVRVADERTKHATERAAACEKAIDAAEVARSELNVEMTALLAQKQKTEHALQAAGTEITAWLHSPHTKSTLSVEDLGPLTKALRTVAEELNNARIALQETREKRTQSDEASAKSASQIAELQAEYEVAKGKLQHAESQMQRLHDDLLAQTHKGEKLESEVAAQSQASAETLAQMQLQIEAANTALAKAEGERMQAEKARDSTNSRIRKIESEADEMAVLHNYATSTLIASLSQKQKELDEVVAARTMLISNQLEILSRKDAAVAQERERATRAESDLEACKGEHRAALHRETEQNTQRDNCEKQKQRMKTNMKTQAARLLKKEQDCKTELAAMRQKLQNNEELLLQVCGDHGKQGTQYTYETSALKAQVAAMEKEKKTPQAAHSSQRAVHGEQKTDWSKLKYVTADEYREFHDALDVDANDTKTMHNFETSLLLSYATTYATQENKEKIHAYCGACRIHDLCELMHASQDGDDAEQVRQSARQILETKLTSGKLTDAQRTFLRAEIRSKNIHGKLRTIDIDDFDPYGDIEVWDVRELTDAPNLYAKVKRLLGNRTVIDLAFWDTRNLINVTGMFAECTLQLSGLESWCTANVTSMRSMFEEANAFNCDIGKWDTAKLADASNMFLGASNFNGNLSQWNTTSLVSSGNMFYEATAFGGDVSRWKTPALRTAVGMFRGASKFDCDLREWDMQHVQNMSYMFCDAQSFTGKGIEGWAVSNVEDMSHMFNSAEKFDADLSKWDVRNVKRMDNMFQGAIAFTNITSVLQWKPHSLERAVDMFTGSYLKTGSITEDTWIDKNDYVGKQDIQFAYLAQSMGFTRPSAAERARSTRSRVRQIPRGVRG
jgi:hypothetical protein